MKKLINYSLQGLLVFTPIFLTVFIIVWLVGFVDKYLTIKLTDNYTVRGGGLILLLIIMPVLGWLVSNYLGKKLVGAIESLIDKIPLIKLVYRSLKDLVGAFGGGEKKFSHPVIVKLNQEGNVRILGFLTRESLDCLGIANSVAVYFPQSYNFAGNVIVVPSSSVEAIAADASEVMTFIVSGGISGPK